MKVVAWVHMGAPNHNAGAELMLHTLLRDLATKGHEVRALLARSPGAMYVHEGVTYSPGVLSAEIDKWLRWADVAITHLDLTRQAVERAHTQQKPIVHLVHNDRQLNFHGVKPELSGQLVVFNSRWIAEKVQWLGRSIVVRPPVFADDYRTEPGDALTLVNLSASKGSETFYELARRLPDKPFLAVKGSYGRQLIPPPHLFPNLTVLDNTPAMRAVYGKTRILLMPSDYESWGRVAVEAAASGIPTIAHPTPGLQEALGNAGIFVDRDDIDGWVRAIAKIDDPKSYARCATASRRRSRALDPTPDLELFEKSLLELIG